MKLKISIIFVSTVILLGVSTASLDWNSSDLRNSPDYSGVTWDGIQDHGNGVQQGYQYGSLTDGLVAYYRMDEGSGQYANDSALSYDGKLGNSSSFTDPSWTSSSKIGSSALDFDGKDDFVNITSFNLRGKSEITVNLWVKPASIPSASPGHGGSSKNDSEMVVLAHDGDALTLNMGSSDELYGYLDPGSNGGTGSESSCSTVTSSSPMTVDSWQMVTGVYDGDKFRVYRNGQKLISCDPGNKDFLYDREEWIGSHILGTSDATNGTVDSVRIYDRGLSSQEVKELYQQTSPQNVTAQDTLQSGLVGWWPLHGNGSTASDLSGRNNDGSLNGGVAQGVAGKAGLSAYSFDGSDDEVVIGDVVNASGPITVSCWVKSSSKADWQGCIDKRKDSSGYNGILLTAYTGSDLPAFYIRGSNNNKNVELKGSSSVTDGEWHHLVGTINSDLTRARLFVDGNQVDSNNLENLSGSIENSANLNLGTAQQGSLGRLNGVMADARIYKRDLSTEEIKALYRSGVKGYAYPPGNESKGVSNWKFNNDTDTSTAEDRWNGNDGTINGAIYSSDSIEGKALNFDGSNDYVNTSLNLGDKKSNISFSAWVKVNGSGFRDVYAEGDTSDGDPNLNFFVDNKNRVRFKTFDGSTGEVGTRGGKVAENRWNHIAGTYSTTSGYTVYLNGRVVNSTSNTTFLTNTVQGDIGRRPDGKGHFNGSIDDLKIFNRTLKPYEVFELYQEGTRGRDMRQETREKGLVGYWSLDEDSGSTAHDLSGHENNGTTKNGVKQGVTGIADTTAYSFDGSDDNVNIPDSTSLDIKNEIAVSFWMKHQGQEGDNAGIVVKDYDGTNSPLTIWRETSQSYDLYFKIGTEDGSNPAITYTGLDSGVWTHWAMVYDQQNLKLYRNSRLVKSISASGKTIYTNDKPLIFGEYAGTNTDMILDNVRIYDRALTKSEIQSLYQSSKHSQIVTSNKSFSQGEKPDLKNLGYNRDGGSMNISVLGYSTPEEQKVSLDGSSNFSLGWSNKHQKFQNVIDFSTGSTSSASFKSLSLEASSSPSPSVSLSWVDNSNSENGFEIIQNASGSFQEVKQVSENVESATDDSSSLDSGEYVCYRVKAFNEYGSSKPAEGCVTIP